MSEKGKEKNGIGTIEFWFLYGGGCKAICRVVAVVDRALDLVLRALDTRRKPEPEGSHPFRKPYEKTP